MLPTSINYISRGLCVCANRYFSVNYLGLCRSTWSISRYGHALPFAGRKSNTSVSCIRSFSRGILSKIGDFCVDKVELVFGAPSRMELALLLYGSTHELEFKKFYTYFEMPDTFFSWFKIVELHTWMLLVRLMDLKENYRLRRELSKCMWADVEVRSKNLGKVITSAVNKQMRDIGSMHTLSLLTYDEGLLGNDMNLASAVWFKFFDKNCPDPRKMEILVGYIRYQINHLDSVNVKDMNVVKNSKIWVPFSHYLKHHELQ